MFPTFLLHQHLLHLPVQPLQQQLSRLKKLSWQQSDESLLVEKVLLVVQVLLLKLP